MSKEILVKKKSGEIEPFDPGKVRHAVLRSGASPDVADKVVSEVKDKISSGVTTKEIYRLVFQLLKREDLRSASRLGLKSALLKLGPAGFPFETFFAGVLREHGYETKTRQILRGAAIKHEIDVVAEKDGKRYMIECKYHNVSSIRTRAQDVLYTFARFLDLNEGAEKGKCPHFHKPWLATNTKFSSEVIKYARYHKMPLTGWGYPRKNSLQELIESKLLYPVTILSSLNKFAKNRLHEADLMMVKDLVSRDQKELMEKTGISRKKMNAILAEADVIVPSH